MKSAVNIFRSSVPSHLLFSQILPNISSCEKSLRNGRGSPKSVVHTQKHVNLRNQQRSTCFEAFRRNTWNITSFQSPVVSLKSLGGGGGRGHPKCFQKTNQPTNHGAIKESETKHVRAESAVKSCKPRLSSN